jgi:hypothetical protein
MDLLLVVLTILSLAAAAGFAVVAWRLQREERHRSAARVAALSSALDALDTLDAFDAPVAADEPVSGVPDAALSVAGASPVPVASMFRMEPGTSVQGRPLIKAAVVGVMAVFVVVAAAMGNRSTGAAASASVAPEQAPLELMSMRHSREGTTLTVTGLVRNPPGGAEARRVTAVVFAFDRNGGFTASGRAALDFVVLEAGDESPFVVTIPNVTEVAKYRVSFRTENGMMRHVDRRAEQMQLAQPIRDL